MTANATSAGNCLWLSIYLTARTAERWAVDENSKHSHSSRRLAPL